MQNLGDSIPKSTKEATVVGLSMSVYKYLKILKDGKAAVSRISKAFLFSLY